MAERSNTDFHRIGGRPALYDHRAVDWSNDDDPFGGTHGDPVSEVGKSAGFSLVAHERGLRQESGAQPLMPIRLGRRGPGLAVGNIGGEGHDDVLVGGTALEAARVLRAGDSARFSAVDDPALANGARIEDGPVLVFDAQGKGVADVLVTRAGASLPAGAPEYQPALFLNDGHGELRPSPPGSLPPLAVCVGAVAAADFEHNGRLGIFLGARALPGRYPLPPRSALLANRGGRFEDVTDALAPGLREVGMVTAALWSDVDGDGWPDLLVTLEWGPVKYFHNNQGRGFEDWTEKAGFAAAGTGWWTSISCRGLQWRRKAG